MKRIAVFAYGLFSYLVFFATFCYLAAFIGDLYVSKSVSRGPEARGLVDLLINALFPVLFAVQHTIMARPRFKAMWTRIIPPAAERSTFVLIASCILAAMMWQWKTSPAVVWSVEGTWAAMLLHAIFFAGWAIVLYSSFLIDHFDLFGLRQVWFYFRGKPYTHVAFAERSLYRLVRHPLMFGFLLAFWAAPVMTVGRLLLASLLTAYILFGTRVEERDLVALHGEAYESYRTRTPMLLPLRLGKRQSSAAEARAEGMPAS